MLQPCHVWIQVIPEVHNKVIWYACCIYIYIYCRYIDLTCIVWIIDIWFVYDIMISICAYVNVFHAFPALDFWPCSARREEPELRPSASDVLESPRGAAVLACHPDGEAAVLPWVWWLASLKRLQGWSKIEVAESLWCILVAGVSGWSWFELRRNLCFTCFSVKKL